MLEHNNGLGIETGTQLVSLGAMFVAWYNYCWQTRKPGKSGEKRPTAAMMAGLAGHVWTFDELFEAVLMPAALSKSES